MAALGNALSGMSMNPVRTFWFSVFRQPLAGALDLFHCTPLGMLTAAGIFFGFAGERYLTLVARPGCHRVSE
jgi:hypothetical protein